MLYTITRINGNEVTLDKEPPSTVVGVSHNGLLISAICAPNTVIISDGMQVEFHLKVRSTIYLSVTKHDSCDIGDVKALRYNEGKTRWSLVDWKSMEPMVQVLEFGAKKYEEENWKKPMDKKQILNSAMRHLIAMMNGEENDPESGLPHHAHASCNMMFYSFHSKSNDSK